MRAIKILAGIILCILTFISVYTSERNFSSMFLATPKQLEATGIDSDVLEKISAMLTYEITHASSAKTLNNTYTMNLIETNEVYPFVMNFNILSGGFFTKDAFENRSKVACLNEKAAFELFGNIDISGNTVTLNNQTYLAVGVINDKDELNPNIYIPLGEEKPNTLMISTDNIEYTLNELKQIGITESNYYIVNLEIISCFAVEKSVIAFLAYTSFIIANYIKKRIFSIITFFTLISWLFTKYTEDFLNWKVSAPMLQQLSSTEFQNEIDFLRSLDLYSNIFLVAFTVIIFMGVSQSKPSHTQTRLQIPDLI